MTDLIAGRIALLDPLARGASGSLWRAIDQRYNAICAAKVMRQRDGADVLRFVREQTVGGSRGLGEHPNLLPPYTWVAEDDTIVLVMPLIHGGTLAGAIDRHGPLSMPLVAHLTRHLLEALGAMHEAGWVHRDVKPANMLLDATGAGPPHMLLADFGIALHERDVRLTATGMINGTPGFMAPEAMAGLTATTSADLWAAGATMAEALAPTPPRTRREPMQRIEPLHELMHPGLDAHSQALLRTLGALLDPVAEARPSVREALDMLPTTDGPLEEWSRAADGARFTVPDQVEPLQEGSPGWGLPEVPLAGPDELALTRGSLHERLSARSHAAASTRESPSPTSDPTEALKNVPTRVSTPQSSDGESGLNSSSVPHPSAQTSHQDAAGSVPSAPEAPAPPPPGSPAAPFSAPLAAASAPQAPSAAPYSAPLVATSTPREPSAAPHSAPLVATSTPQEPSAAPTAGSRGRRRGTGIALLIISALAGLVSAGLGIAAFTVL